jgi:hypothetical protein
MPLEGGVVGRVGGGVGGDRFALEFKLGKAIKSPGHGGAGGVGIRIDLTSNRERDRDIASDRSREPAGEVETRAMTPEIARPRKGVGLGAHGGEIFGEGRQHQASKSSICVI